MPRGKKFTAEQIIGKLHGATINAVPEPSMMTLVMTGGLGAWLIRRRRAGARGG